MLPNGLDSGVIEVTGVAQETATDLVGVLQTLEDIIDEGELAPLPQLELPRLLVGGMNRVQPLVMVGSL